MVLIACTFATMEMTEKLGDYKEHPFGKSMVNLITVNMKTGGSLNELK